MKAMVLEQCAPVEDAPLAGAAGGVASTGSSLTGSGSLLRAGGEFASTFRRGAISGARLPSRSARTRHTA